MEDGVALPEDVLIEILVNLPIKSLSRFSCVSKYWCDLIKSPNFVSRHLNHDCKETLLVISKLRGTEGGRGRDVFSFHDPESLDLLVSPNLSIPDFWDNSDGEPFFDFLGICNGLVCLAFHTKVILCNPALREFELLPPTPFDCSEDYETSCCATAFGFDAINDAYKVVRLWNIADREKYFAEDHDIEDSWNRIDLYDSRTNSWRLIDAAVPVAHEDDGSNLFFNGACHWCTQPLAILSFNLSTEVFRGFELPHLGDSMPTLGILNECLAVFCLRELLIAPGHLAEEQPVDIWVMKEYGVKESWTKEFVIGPYAIDRPILLWNNKWLLAETLEHLLVSCALHCYEIRRSHVHANYESVLVAIFKESLVSLKQVIHGNT